MRTVLDGLRGEGGIVDLGRWQGAQAQWDGFRYGTAHPTLFVVTPADIERLHTYFEIAFMEIP